MDFSDAELLESAENGLHEALANTLLLINAWVNADMTRTSGEATAIEQIEGYSVIVALIGQELFTVLHAFPELAGKVYDLHDAHQDVLKQMIQNKMQEQM